MLGEEARVSNRAHVMMSERCGGFQSNFALLGLLPGAELWTGIKKGPPRKLKFPEPQEVVEELKKYLS